MRILHDGRDDNLNLRSAWLHVLTDALGSVGVLIAGVLVYAFNWQAADPITSIAIGLITLYSAGSIVKEAVSILMESSPGHVNVETLKTSLLSVPGVLGVHDLHVWTILSGADSVSAHVLISEAAPADELLPETRLMLLQKFSLDHVTLQLEREQHDETNVH